MAGQVNGTTGYEEAAAQGILAGVNASKFAANESMVSFERERSFIGTMVDDLITRPLREPYRVLTSRSEYRLVLRADNADQRLTPMGRELGLIDDRRWKMFMDKQNRIQGEIKRLQSTRILESSTEARQLQDQCDISIKQSATLHEILRRPHVEYKNLELAALGASDLRPFEKDSVQIEVKYSGYISRQLEVIDKQRASDAVEIPSDIDYMAIGELRMEAREKLTQHRPRTIGLASKLGGVNPADITVLLIELNRRKRRNARRARESNAATTDALAQTPVGS